MPIKKFSDRFSDLLLQVEAVKATKKLERSEYSGEFYTIDNSLMLSWQVKCRNLLSASCGEKSVHFTQFTESEKPQRFRDKSGELSALIAVMIAAQEDYDGGYLDTVKSLVQAEVFGEELDQARELLSLGYTTSAAVIAGVVLETKLRDMVVLAGLPLGKLDKMNSDLSKAGVYTLSVQKRITALADIRNNAAHGHPTKFTQADVEDLIQYTERFLADHP